MIKEESMIYFCPGILECNRYGSDVFIKGKHYVVDRSKKPIIMLNNTCDIFSLKGPIEEWGTSHCKKVFVSYDVLERFFKPVTIIEYSIVSTPYTVPCIKIGEHQTYSEKAEPGKYTVYKNPTIVPPYIIENNTGERWLITIDDLVKHFHGFEYEDYDAGNTAKCIKHLELTVIDLYGCNRVELNSGHTYTYFDRDDGTADVCIEETVEYFDRYKMLNLSREMFNEYFRKDDLNDNE